MLKNKEKYKPQNILDDELYRLMRNLYDNEGLAKKYSELTQKIAQEKYDAKIKQIDKIKNEDYTKISQEIHDINIMRKFDVEYLKKQRIHNEMRIKKNRELVRMRKKLTTLQYLKKQRIHNEMMRKKNRELVRMRKKLTTLQARA